MSTNHPRILEQSILRLIELYQRNPFNFLYEIDLQARLFALLCDGFGDDVVTMRGGFHDEADYPGGSIVRTIPVKCEYPSKELFDIALIDSAHIQDFDAGACQRDGWANDRFWDQPVSAAVELKYLQLGDRLESRVHGVDADVDKLRRYLNKDPGRPFLGVALIFIQSANPGAAVPFKAKSEASAMPTSGIVKFVVTPTEQWRYMAPTP